jgi:hypothetical protein
LNGCEYFVKDSVILHGFNRARCVQDTSTCRLQLSVQS